MSYIHGTLQGIYGESAHYFEQKNGALRSELCSLSLD